jgi:hypothetical protein
MTTVVDRTLLYILSKDALDVMCNIEVIFVHVFRARIAQYFRLNVTCTNNCMLCC